MILIYRSKERCFIVPNRTILIYHSFRNDSIYRSKWNDSNLSFLRERFHLSFQGTILIYHRSKERCFIIPNRTILIYRSKERCFIILNRTILIYHSFRNDSIYRSKWNDSNLSFLRERFHLSFQGTILIYHRFKERCFI